MELPKDMSKGAMNLVEDLASLEHEQWMSWTKSINDKIDDFTIEELVREWKKKWIPYSELSEEDKNKDRFWAQKVLFTQWDSAVKEAKRREDVQKSS